MTKNEILELFNILNELNSWLINKREENALAKQIQFPKTPPALSEAIALNLLQDKLILRQINFENLRLGGADADIIGEINGKDITIEIKATTTGFQYFGKKDINARYLIWIDLENPLRHQMWDIDIYILPNPNQYFKVPRKISLNTFLTLTQKTRTNFNIDIFQYLNN